MRTAEIRERWLGFFESKGHVVVPSASLVSSDPTIMFTVAGMVPFIPYLTGLVPSPYPRATSVQKCIRTNDIEEVGRTPRHGTFFQMNGNFSFGDYFEEGAITYAWELLTKPQSEGGYGFAERDLWVTVYQDDEEARALWRRVSGLPDDRIQGLGKDSNYWSTGQPGPAGPCSEIFFDRGPRYGRDGGPETDDDRYVEIWNLVFMQYLIDDVQSKTEFRIVSELPKKNIDTGMGLERMAFIMQGVDNMYEIDQVRPVLDRAAEISGRRYGADHADDVRLRVVADHVRSAMMVISDGVSPANEGRGYILRRLLRRTTRAMRLLGVHGLSFAELFAASRDAMGAAYPEVVSNYAAIERTAVAEEEAFLNTLTTGTTILNLAVSRAREQGSREVGGDTAFLLHDTYGFPIELTLEMAEDAGLAVDQAKFETLMAEQRSRAKADAKSRKRVLADLSVYSEFRGLGETLFLGYDQLDAEATVIGVLVNGVSVPSAVTGSVAEILLDATTLYAEAGGQAPDEGLIVGDGVELDVLDVQRPVPGLSSHTVRVAAGEVRTGMRVITRVDREYRRHAAEAHSGTHLVHAALRQVLGPESHQAGSYNRAGYLRLDYSWTGSISAAARSEIEDVANQAIWRNLPVTTRTMPLDEAKASGAMALFGEKYGDQVRVVDIGGPWSRELCAGTHVASSAEIGILSVISESSVGSSARRVESLVGPDAFKQLAAERAIVSEISAGLKTPAEDLPSRVHDLAVRLKSAERRIAEFERERSLARVPSLLNTVHPVGRFRVVAQTVQNVGSADELRDLATALRGELGPGEAVVALAAVIDGLPRVVVAATPTAVDAGASAGELVRLIAPGIDGKGGGKPDLAQCGGKNAGALASALQLLERSLSNS